MDISVFQHRRWARHLQLALGGKRAARTAQRWMNCMELMAPKKKTVGTSHRGGLATEEATEQFPAAKVCSWNESNGHGSKPKSVSPQ